MDIEKLKYPIGKFSHSGEISEQDLQRWIDEIEALPGLLRKAIKNLIPSQLDTPYRPDGWTLRQVVHHISDSHLNGMIRFKWALTEETPTIKPYFEERWAELPDYKFLQVELSLDFLELLHKRWVTLLRALNRNDFSREFIHPESGRTDLASYLGLYAWHGKHHLTHITNLLESKGWV